MSDARTAAVPTPIPPSNESPDWSQIKHDVHCPLCEYNLRGIRDPRCPECGYRFDWPDVLSATRVDHPYLFEHHPERNVWSYWKTAVGTWFPRRFWRLLHPTQRSRPIRLISFWFIGIPLLLLANGAVYLSSISTEVNATMARRSAQKQRLLQRASEPWTQAVITQYGSIDKYLDTSYPIATVSSVLNSRINAGYMPHVLLLNELCLPMLWPWLSLLTLSIFRWSMRRARIKSMHVLRCALYSFDLTLWTGILIVAAAVLSLTSTEWHDWDPALLFIRDFTILIGTYRLAIAYREYLRFDHAWLTAISSQIIAILLVLTLRCALEPGIAYREFLTDPLSRIFVGVN